MRIRLTALINCALGAFAAVSAGTVLAQGMGGGGGGKPRAGGEGEARSFLVSPQLDFMSGETLGHMEFNLGGQGTIGLEGVLQSKLEHVSEKEQLLTGESLVTSARGVGILVARYTDPMTMGGFYWSLGVGYREEAAKWSVKPEDNDKGVDLNLVDAASGRLNHDATLKGSTATARLGYRFVGSDIPLVVGLYIGARHFQATVRDVEHKSEDGTADAGSGEETVTYNDMTELEKNRLKRSFMTTAHAALEVGVVF